VHTLKVFESRRLKSAQEESSWNYDEQDLAHPISAFLTNLTAAQLNHSAAASPPFLHEPHTHTALGGVTFI